MKRGLEMKDLRVQRGLERKGVRDLRKRWCQRKSKVLHTCDEAPHAISPGGVTPAPLTRVSRDGSAPTPTARTSRRLSIHA